MSQILSWSDEEARAEFKWLTFMSAYKYDGYGDYLAGFRFIESFATWLQQFNQEERRIAYNFVKSSLIYFSASEVQRLVERFYRDLVQKEIVQSVSSRLNIPKYKIWSTKANKEEYYWELRKTIFMGLSDGARTDSLRRANVGIISNEQIVASSQVDTNKWNSLINDLRTELEKKRSGCGKSAKFSTIYLIDDFTASGTSLLRHKEDTNEYKGKLQRFYQSVDEAKKDLIPRFGDFLETDWTLIIHHYIGTEQAKRAILERYAKLAAEHNWFNKVKFTYSMILPANIVLDAMSSDPFATLCKNYYDPSIENSHSEESGNRDMTYGYGQCGLPVVLEHNTPNNSLPLIWAESRGSGNKKPMRPLFRRRQRHTDLIG